MNDPLAYGVLAATATVCSVVDLAVGTRGEPTVRRAARDYALWTALGLAIAIPIGMRGEGGDAVSYLTVFILEKTLSLDNVAVIAAVLTGFAVARSQRSRLLQQGIVGALVLRIAFILAGVVLLEAVRPILIPAGLLLVYTGLRMLRRRGHETGAQGPPQPPPGARLLSRIPGLASRPTLAPLVALVVADAVFAVDSVPAAFGVTTDAFVVISANAFSILGLRPTYQLLAGGLDRFPLLEPAVAVLLVILGIKLALEEVVHVPDAVSLAVVFVVIGGGIGLSLVRDRKSTPTALG